MRDGGMISSRDLVPLRHRVPAFFLVLAWGEVGMKKEERENKIKALSRDRCHVLVCTSFFRETCVSGGETGGAGLAENRHCQTDFARWAADRVRPDER